jgi:CheY-like chemotaxis protein
MISPLNNHRTILLIDDDEDDCFLFSRALSELNPNLDVKNTYSTDNLILVLERTRPSIIFIDLHLPKQNGFECLRLIRSHSAFTDIPVIFWSGSCNSNNLTSAYNEGAQYYFEKPNCLSDLVAELKKILSSYQVLENPLYGAPCGCY